MRRWGGAFDFYMSDFFEIITGNNSAAVMIVTFYDNEY